MSLNYEVRNAFSSAHGSFPVGTVIPAAEVAAWPAETANNRILNGDIVPVVGTQTEEEVPSPTEIVNPDDKTDVNPDGGSEKKADGKKGSK